MAGFRLPDRYRFNFKYHLAIGSMVLSVLLVYWFGVLVPAHQTHRHDIWGLLIVLVVLFYGNFLNSWPWCIQGETLAWHRMAGIVFSNLFVASVVGLWVSFRYGGLSINFSEIGLAAGVLTLFDGSVSNFYAYLTLPVLAILALSFFTFYIEWTHGPFANRKDWQRQLAGLRMAWRRAQLDPHLLDMHLVVLSAVTRKSKAKAQQALDYTIRVVHFHIGGNEPGAKIRLVDEIETVRCVLEIQRIRFGQRMNWHFSVGDGLEQIEMMAMTIMVFVENQIRYAVLDDPEKPAVLEVGLRNGQLVITARNYVRRVKPRHGSGTGMANLKERLADSYPGRFRLESWTDGDCYTAELAINDIFA